MSFSRLLSPTFSPVCYLEKTAKTTLVHNGTSSLKKCIYCRSLHPHTHTHHPHCCLLSLSEPKSKDLFVDMKYKKPPLSPGAQTHEPAFGSIKSEEWTHRHKWGAVWSDQGLVFMNHVPGISGTTTHYCLKTHEASLSCATGYFRLIWDSLQNYTARLLMIPQAMLVPI